MLSALDLARRIEAGEIAAAAVVDLCAEAIAGRESEIGAFVTYDLETARRAAATPAAASPSIALRGLPVGIKDIFDTVDFPTEYGSAIYAVNDLDGHLYTLDGNGRTVSRLSLGSPALPTNISGRAMT